MQIIDYGYKIAILSIYFILLGVGYADACSGGEKIVKKQLINEFLKAHNLERKSVGVKPLVWNKGLAEVAENYARQLAQRCGKLVHSKELGYGENLAASWGGQDRTGTEVTAMWTKERKFYDPKASNWCVGGECRHWTQVVWSRTKDVGCGKASCTDKSGAKKTYYVCEYDPAGNFRGQKPF